MQESAIYYVNVKHEKIPKAEMSSAIKCDKIQYPVASPFFSITLGITLRK